MIWVDNVWLLANEAFEMQFMPLSLSMAVHAIGLDWKPSSLELLYGAGTV